MIPAPGTLPDYRRDAQATFEILKAGGTVIGPAGVGYTILSISAEAVERSFAAKQRREGHTMGIFTTGRNQAQLHDLPEDKLAMCRMMSETMGTNFVVIANYKKDSPQLKALSPETFKKITRGDTLGLALMAQDTPFLYRVCELAEDAGFLMSGSSANMSGTGNNFRVSDIQPEVLDAVDAIVDYGLQQFYTTAPRASCMIDLRTMTVLRTGAGYNLLRDRMWRFFGIEFPEDPDYKMEYALEQRS
jgi:tRNA A37 threonylcarbamoyladenosine synthetase subunit TsaC/SUA5/YrdC